MNQRIRELAEQAGYRPLPGSDFANLIEETYLKKFAELIVQECVAVCWAEDGPESGTDAGWYLKEHFGVEE